MDSSLGNQVVSTVTQSHGRLVMYATNVPCDSIIRTLHMWTLSNNCSERRAFPIGIGHFLLLIIVGIAWFSSCSVQLGSGLIKL